MNTDVSELVAATRLAIAALVGVGVGLEREWSSHTRPREPRFAGLRTFMMLGAAGGCAGLLFERGAAAVAAAIVAGVAALAVAAYASVARRPDATVDGTTESAALLVVGLGVLSGLGWMALSAAAASVVVLALSEKERLHDLVRHLREDELRAALGFSVLALVVLPLLPVQIAWGKVRIEPRGLWIIVLFFCALNFAGFVVRRSLGPGRGFGVLGLLGGLISSTAVTFDFSRRSRREPALGTVLGHGVVGACTVLIPRVFVVSVVLNPRVALSLLPLLGPAAVIGLAMVWWNLRTSPRAGDVSASANRNPLRLGLALQMAAAFQVAMSVIDIVRQQWATPGLFVTALALGLTDVDALTVGMSRVEAALEPRVAAHAIAIGILSNTVFKLGLALTMGERRFKRTAASGLIGMAAATATALWVF